ncbi:MAG: stage II sporulation protein M [Gemmatimonadetes bacterium]|nr:stage II sporulation protein M [Gemmatimonadota bacterium]
MTQPQDFRQHLEVETPEHVLLDYEIAGIGSRALAAILDTLILGAWIILLFFITGILSLGLGAWTLAVFGVVSFASMWGYFTFFEGLRNGQTPGKRRLGIRVVRDSGHAVSLGAAAARNLLRVADFLPPPYLIGAVAVALHPRGKRLGDLVAGTVVVRDRPVEAPVAAAAARELPEALGVPELDDEEFRLLREYSERADSLPAEVRGRLADRLVLRFAPRYPVRAAAPDTFLAELYGAELARRRGRFGARQAQPASGAPRAPAGGAVERLIVRQSPRWDAFQLLAQRATERGLDSFDGAELPDFAARYREVAADLARARTYGAPPAVRTRLERLVAAGHNVLYRDERHTGRRAWQFVMQECPAGIVEAWRVVLLAFLLFTLPGLAGYQLLRERPSLAEELLPPVMLERAEAGVAREREGRGYYEAEAEARPFMASSIMTNNIGVAFYCFAGGIFAGVGSLFLLAFNGLAMGTISGHFANLGLLDYLWTFVIGHGVLELFAIWVAGAAGFLLGRALIAPGDLTRADALVVAGRLALRMIGGAILFLVIAGLIEGFVSASTESLAYRLAVSSASLLFLLAYLSNGWLYLRGEGRGRVSTPA